VRLIAESFAWPLRARPSTWAWGLIMVLLLPVLFVPLLGYAIAATRAAEAGQTERPPRMLISRRLLSDGFWTSVAIALSLAPFAFAFWGFTHVAGGIGLVVVFFLLALPWGIVSLLWLPHATASFAATARFGDLFDVPAALRDVRGDFVTWNVAAAAIVTAWAIGVACAGLLCVGIVPGVFYAILVSAHAAAALHREGTGAGLPAR
jgi:hypothetical protein